MKGSSPQIQPGPRRGSSARAAGSGESLRPSIQSDLEARFGEDLSTVEIRRGPDEAESARLLGTKAYTVGETISFAGGRYQPATASGRQLLSHEITHVLQQRRGGPRPGVAHEAEAEANAGAGAGPLTVEQGAGIGLAAAPEDWIGDRPDIDSWSHSQLMLERDAIRQWLDRQTQSTPESEDLQLALEALSGELEYRRDRRAAARRQGATPGNSGEPFLSSLETPRILDEQTSIIYESTTEVNEEYDRIMAALEDQRLSTADRQLLEAELISLRPDFDQGRLEAATDRWVQRLAEVFEVHAGNGAAQLLGIAEQLGTFRPDPADPEAMVAHHDGERIVLPAKVAELMRVKIAAAFDDGAYQIQLLAVKSFAIIDRTKEVNARYPLTSAVSGLLAWVDDPTDEMNAESELVDQALIELAAAIRRDDYVAAAHRLIEAETAVTNIYRSAKTFIDGYKLGASRALLATEIATAVALTAAAALSGALVAGAVYAAAGGGAMAFGGAVLAGGATGAATKGTLQGGLALGREGLATVADPDHDFNLHHVGSEALSGVKSGAIDGGLGAAGGLITPGLTNWLAMRHLGGPAATLSRTRFAAANAASGTLVGLPSGVAGTGIELGDDLLAGRISVGDYGKQVLLSGAVEGLFGGATGALPIDQLISRGLLPTRRSMFEGVGHSPFPLHPDFAPTLDPRRMSGALEGRYQFNPQGELFSGYNSQAGELLPPLPGSDAHVRVGGLWLPHASSGRAAGSYSLIVQGGSYNFITGGEMLSGGPVNPVRLLKSFASTLPDGGLQQQARSRMGVKVFREVTVGVDGSGATVYNNVLDSSGRQLRYVSGHNVGLVDIPAGADAPVPLGGTGAVAPTARHPGARVTRATEPIANLNETVTNYSPEPGSDPHIAKSTWGENYRSTAEQRVRELGGGYVQLNLPGNRLALGSSTSGSNIGTLIEVPDFIIFARTNADGDVITAWRVDFRNPPSEYDSRLMDFDNPDTVPELGANQAIDDPMPGSPIVRVPLTRLAKPTIGKLHYIVPMLNSESEIQRAIADLYSGTGSNEDR